MPDRSDINRLAQVIMEEIPGEPSQSEGAVDCAIRLLRQAYATGMTNGRGNVVALVRPRLITAEVPEVVVLCGSTKDMDVWREVEQSLELMGKIVLTVPVAKGELRLGDEIDALDEDAIDELHLRRIDLADRVYVLDVDGYVGLSTRREIDYARNLGKPVMFLSDGE